ncbi:MAG: transposase [Minisyncoccia bacterium]
MPSRKVNLVEGEYYHIYNRGVDKRNIFSDKSDLQRFLQSMEEFNTKDPIGSLYENSFVKEKELGGSSSKLVQFIAYCLNPNHYHFILTPLVEKGIEKFMQRLGTGYTLYFNEKEKRSGSLFQGKFKSKHINSNAYLLQASSYVNLNNYDKNGIIKKSLNSSSWIEYIGQTNINFCKKSIVLGQFESKKEYEKFALETWKETCQRKEEVGNLEFS